MRQRKKNKRIIGIIRKSITCLACIAGAASDFYGRVFKIGNEYCMQCRCSPVPACIQLWWCRAVDIVSWVCANVQLNADVFMLSFKYLHIYSPKVAVLEKKNGKIASLMCCQRSDLQKTLKYSHRRDLEDIQRILWIQIDAAPVGRQQNTVHICASVGL